jgi:hypothetical protein
MDVGYLGTHSDDRQPPLEMLMLNAAKALTEASFVVAGRSIRSTYHGLLMLNV